MREIPRLRGNQVGLNAWIRRLPGAVLTAIAATLLLTASQTAPAAASTSPARATTMVTRSPSVTPADTSIASGTWWLVDYATAKCLDSNTAGNVYTNPCQAPSNHYQVWIWTEWQATAEDGSTYEFYSFKDEATGRCLDSNAAGSLYTTNPCQAPGNPYQDWYRYSTVVNYTGPYSIFTDVATGLCLDSNFALNAYTHSCNGGNYQYWYPEG